jgi:hypothetical protein
LTSAQRPILYRTIYLHGCVTGGKECLFDNWQGKNTNLTALMLGRRSVSYSPQPRNTDREERHDNHESRGQGNFL